MKALKILIVTIGLFSTNSIYSQIKIELSNTDFWNISIDQNTLNSISNSNGEDQDIIQLFGNQNYEKTTSDSPVMDWSNYKFTGLGRAMLLTYNENISGNLSLSGLQITGSNIPIQIGNKTFSVGDNVNILRFLPLSTQSVGFKYLHYYVNGNDSVFYVKYNTKTMIIVETGLLIP